MRKTDFKFLLSFFITGLIFFPVHLFSQVDSTQSTHSSTKPKIGVVLSGGGALGMAHIGVLKVLEERGIKPDFIVGTSMGSVVGGLYALGYTADEIQALTQTMNWELILSSYIPLTYVAYEEKADYERYTISFPFKKGKPTLPTGLIESQLLLEKLTEFTWSGINYESFDDYPIPFRCVATDVSTGKEKIFDSGSLAIAMRSSMAIPTVFTAVNLDSTLYVDGGAINNYPVDLARSLGADYIIGSDVTSGIKHAYDIDNMVGILYQVAMYPSLWKMAENIANTDVYIHPDVSAFTAADFVKSDFIIQKGKEEATKQIDKLDSLCVSIGHKTQKIENHILPYPDTILLTHVDYNTGNPLHIDQINDGVDCSVGTNLEIKSFKHYVRLMYGSLKYRTITYWAEPDSMVEDAYTFDMHFDKNPKTNIKVGLQYDNVFSVGIATNFTTHDFLVKNSRLKLKMDVSPNFKGEIEVLKYFGKKNYFNMLVDYSFYALNTPIYSSGNLNEYVQSNTHQFTAKFQTNNKLNSKFGVGYFFYNNRGTSVIGDNVFKGVKLNSTHNILFAEYQINTLNKNYHPTWGARLSVRADVVMSNQYKIKYPKNQKFIDYPVDSIMVPISEAEFNQIVSQFLTPKTVYTNVFMKYKQIFRVSKSLKFITNLGTALTFGPTQDEQIYRYFNTGGNVKMFYFDYQVYGLNYAESQTNNLAVMRADFQYSPVKHLFVYMGVNYLMFKDYGIGKKAPTNGTYIDSELFGYGLNLAYKTPVGPVELGASLNNRDKSVRWNFQIGFQF